MTQVHAEDRRVVARVRDGAGGVEQRPVPAKHDDQVYVGWDGVARARLVSRGGLEERGRVLVEYRRHSAVHEPRAQPLQVIGGGHKAALGHDADSGDGHG